MNGLLALLAVVLLYGSSCCIGPGLGGTSWKMTALNNEKAIQDTYVTLSFGLDGQLSGIDGCNRFSGTYEAKDNKITMKPSATATSACTGFVMKQATDFTGALSSVISYDLQSDKLTLKDVSGNELVRLIPLKAASLMDTKWTAISYNNGKGSMVNVLNDIQITAVFGKNSKVTGRSGCNSYDAKYQTDGLKITIQPAATTKMACAAPVMDQEQLYLKALEKTARYQVGVDMLELRDADGKPLVSYRVVR
ncbi:MAG: META domain-containing protein [Dehalococcoidia bacterium]|nr:META domain-containing protein [Dehalococcoidia bacterium]MDD5495258.1 META domain-containing protein [Dehalococcoidia bacterium]